MKQILLMIVLSIALFLIGCESPSESKEVEDVTLTEMIDTLTYEWKDYELLRTDCEVSDLDECKFYNSKFIVVTNSGYDFLNDSISKLLIGNADNMETEAKRLYEEYKEVENEDPEYTLTWQFDTKMAINYNQNGIFSFQNTDYVYTGGAHGMYGSFGTNVDLEAKKVLAFYDLVNESDSSELKILGEKKFREAMELDETVEFRESGYFWEGEFYLSDNFSIDENGITFTYLPYEIAAYAYGMPQFTISLKALKPYFTEKSPLKRLVQ